MTSASDEPRKETLVFEPDEARMRRALGIEGVRRARERPRRVAPDRNRHQFVRDGEVPVIVLNPTSTEAAVSSLDTEEALRTERASRKRLERELQQAQALIQSLQTKLAHAEMAHDEALATERQARDAAELALREVRLGQDEPEAAADAAIAPTERSRPAARVRRRSPPEDDQTPVQWWLPGWRDKFDRS